MGKTINLNLVGAALFALEIPHRRGLQYFEAIAPAIIAAIFSFAVFRRNTGITIGGFYHFEEVHPSNLILEEVKLVPGKQTTIPGLKKLKELVSI